MTPPAHRLSYSKKSYYPNELRRILTRRIKKHLSVHGVDKHGHYDVYDSHPEKAEFLRSFLRDLYPRMNLRVVPAIAKLENTFVFSSLEEEVSQAFVSFVENEPSIARPLSPFSVCTQEELKVLQAPTSALYAHPLLTELELQQAGTMFALHNSLEIIKKIKKIN